MLSPRRLLLIALALLAVGSFLLLFRTPPVVVEVAVVKRGPLQVTVDEEGETRVRERYVIAAPVSGRLDRITLDEGDPVRTGAVIARLHPLPLDPRFMAEARARLEAAEAAKREADARLAQARAALAQARRDARRARQLSQDGMIAKEERERAELAETTREQEVDAAEHAVERADFEVRATRAALLASGSEDGSGPPGADTTLELQAPSDGAILRVHEDSERVVQVGAPLVEIGDPRELEIVIDVLSADAVGIRPGARVELDHWGGEQPLAASVRLVEPSGFTKISALGVEEQRVNVIADFVEPPAALGDGYRLDAHIVTWEGDDALQVPTSSLFRHQGQWCVFVADDDTARRRAVEVGHRNPRDAEIRGGLEEGTLVILHPSDQLGDGVPIEYQVP